MCIFCSFNSIQHNFRTPFLIYKSLVLKRNKHIYKSLVLKRNKHSLTYLLIFWLNRWALSTTCSSPYLWCWPLQSCTGSSARWPGSTSWDFFQDFLPSSLQFSCYTCLRFVTTPFLQQSFVTIYTIAVKCEIQCFVLSRGPWLDV